MSTEGRVVKWPISLAPMLGEETWFAGSIPGFSVGGFHPLLTCFLYRDSESQTCECEWLFGPAMGW